MIYIPTENEAGMRLDFLASLLREGDRLRWKEFFTNDLYS